MHQGPQDEPLASEQHTQPMGNLMVPPVQPMYPMPPCYLPSQPPMLPVTGFYPWIPTNMFVPYPGYQPPCVQPFVPTQPRMPLRPTLAVPKEPDKLNSLREQIDLEEASLEIQLIFIKNPKAMPSAHGYFSLQDYLKTHEQTKQNKIKYEDEYFDLLLERILKLSKNTAAFVITRSHANDFYAAQRMSYHLNNEAIFLHKQMQMCLFKRLLDEKVSRREPTQKALAFFKKALIQLTLFEYLDTLPKIKTNLSDIQDQEALRESMSKLGLERQPSMPEPITPMTQKAHLWGTS